MNGLKCPNCDLVNLLDAENCHRCGNSLENLLKTAQVSVPIDQTFRAQVFKQEVGEETPRDNELGQNTFFWYRVYCLVMLMIYLLFTGLGIALLLLPAESNTGNLGENIAMGIGYGVFGSIFSLIYGVALFLPRKSYNWIVGIVLIAFGMTSCCFLPATIPLLIYWVKPETKAYLGRS